MDFSNALENLPGALYFALGVGVTTYLVLYLYRYFICPFIRWAKKKISPND